MKISVTDEEIKGITAAFAFAVDYLHKEEDENTAHRLSDLGARIAREITSNLQTRFERRKKKLLFSVEELRAKRSQELVAAKKARKETYQENARVKTLRAERQISFTKLQFSVLVSFVLQDDNQAQLLMDALDEAIIYERTSDNEMYNEDREENLWIVKDAVQLSVEQAKERAVRHKARGKISKCAGCGSPSGAGCACG